MLGRIQNFVFGFDYFISYAHADGEAYANSLYRELTKRSFVCFIDSKEYEHGANWRIDGRRALKKSRQLILIGTPKARQSQPVYEEIHYFRQLLDDRRKVIPIDLNGSLHDDAESNKLLQLLGSDTLSIRHDLQPTEIEPSAEVLSKIISSFKLRRQNDVRRRVITGVAVALLIMLLTAVVLAVLALQSARKERAARLKSESREYTLQIQAASTLIRNHESGRARDILLGTLPSKRNWEWAYLLSRCGPAPTLVHQEFVSSLPMRMKEYQLFLASAVAEMTREPTSVDASESPESAGDQTLRQNSDSASLGNQLLQKHFKYPDDTSTLPKLDKAVRSRTDLIFEWAEYGERSGTAGIVYRQKPTSALLYLHTGMYGSIDEARFSPDSSSLLLSIEADNQTGAATDTGDHFPTSGLWLFGLRDYYDLAAPTAFRTLTESRLLVAIPDTSENPQEKLYSIDRSGPETKITTTSVSSGNSECGEEFDRLREQLQRNGADSTFVGCQQTAESEIALAFDALGRIEVWDTEDKRLLGVVGNQRETKLAAEEAAIFEGLTAKAVAISRDHKMIFGFPLRSGTAGHVFELGTGRQISIVQNPDGTPYEFPGELGTVHNEVAYFSPQGNYVYYYFGDRNEHKAGAWVTLTGKPASWMKDQVHAFAWDSKEEHLVLLDKDTIILKNDEDRPVGKIVGLVIQPNLGSRQQFVVNVSPDKTRMQIGNYVIDTSDYSVILELPRESYISPNWSSVVTIGPSGEIEWVSLAFWSAILTPESGLKLSLRDSVLVNQVETSDRLLTR